MKELDIVCGAIIKENKFLITKRAKGVDEGFWEFAGGKVEKNESNVDAIKRELKEELDIDVNVIQYICSVDDIRKDITLHVHAYLCEIKEGSIQLHVHDEYKWVEARDLYQFKFQEADKKILDEINKIVV